MGVEWKKAVGAALLIFLFDAAPARGQDLSTGRDLLSSCNEAIADMEGRRANQWEAGRCLGFFRGFSHGLRFATTRYGGTVASYLCGPPSGTSVEQDIRLSVRYLASNPKRLHENAGTLVVAAFNEAWPCTAR